MLFLFLLLGAAVVAVLVWRTVRAGQSSPTDDRPDRPDQPWSAATRTGTRQRASGPDDDPEFLQQLGRQVRGEDDPSSG